VVRPVGELDLATVPLVDAQLAELWSVGFKQLILDLREVRFLDSTGIRMLYSWETRAKNDGVAFSVIPGPQAVQRVLEIAGVDDRLTYAPVDGHH
jgi:anti-sigma B factor antagonist